MRQTLHPNEHAALPFIRPPAIHIWRKPSPTAKVEVADAEIGARRTGQSFLQSRQ